MFKKLIPTSEWIVHDFDDIMKVKNDDVTFPLTENDKEVISKMLSYVDASYDGSYKKYNIQPGIGIASIQLGYPKKIIYIHLDDENEKEQKYLLANAKIVKHSINKMYITSGEGCLSVKDKHKGYSIRHQIIYVKAYDLFENKEIEIKAKGILSVCLQHEIDHTNNLFFYDRINKLNPFETKQEWEKI